MGTLGGAALGALLIALIATPVVRPAAAIAPHSSDQGASRRNGSSNGATPSADEHRELESRELGQTVANALQSAGKRHRLKEKWPLKVDVNADTHVGVALGSSGGKDISWSTQYSHSSSHNGKQITKEEHHESYTSSGSAHPAAASPSVLPRSTVCKQMMGAELTSPEDIKDYPCFPPGTNSLLSKFLSPEVWDALKDSVDSYGYSFKHAIFSGAKNTHSGVGVYAGGHLGYYQFEAMFGRVIQFYHGHGPYDEHISNMNGQELKCPPFPEDEAAMINSVRIRVARNFEGYPLGTAISKEQRRAVRDKVLEALSTFAGDLKGKYYALDEVSDQDRKTLAEEHFLFEGGDPYFQVAGLERDWPDARGIFHNDAKTLLMWVNEEDQLRIISMQTGADIRQVFERLAHASTMIQQKAKFANDKHLGYITSCPTNLGTGMRTSVHVKLPNLGKHMEEFKKIADTFHVHVLSADGQHNATPDSDVFDISNKRRMGFSEVTLVQDMYDAVKALIAAEKAIVAGSHATHAAEAVVKSREEANKNQAGKGGSPADANGAEQMKADAEIRQQARVQEAKKNQEAAAAANANGADQKKADADGKGDGTANANAAEQKKADADGKGGGACESICVPLNGSGAVEALTVTECSEQHLTVTRAIGNDGENCTVMGFHIKGRDTCPLPIAVQTEGKEHHQDSDWLAKFAALQPTEGVDSETKQACLWIDTQSRGDNGADSADQKNGDQKSGEEE